MLRKVILVAMLAAFLVTPTTVSFAEAGKKKNPINTITIALSAPRAIRPVCDCVSSVTFYPHFAADAATPTTSC